MSEITHGLRALRLAEDTMRADSPPNNVGFARIDCLTIVESSAAVRRPGQLPYTGAVSHPLDTKLWGKPLVPQTCNQKANCREECNSLALGETAKVAQETALRLVRRHSPLLVGWR